MSWLIPEDENDRRPKVVLGYDWIVYFFFLMPLLVATIMAFLTPIICWLCDLSR